MGGLVSGKYFESVSKAVRRQGLKLFSKTSISSSDKGYRNINPPSRATGLYFHLPGKNLLVSLSFIERGGVGPKKFWKMLYRKKI